MIFFDGNARMLERGYSLIRGPVEDLAKLGLSLASAVGMRFTFVMHDTDGHGNADDIMFNGIGIRDPKWVAWLSPTRKACTCGPRSRCLDSNCRWVVAKSAPGR